MKKDQQKIDSLLSQIIDRIAEIKGILKEDEEAPKVEAEAAKPTLEDVRKVLTEKSRNGKTGEVKALLRKHGSNRLSEVNPDDYEDLLKEAEGL